MRRICRRADLCKTLGVETDSTREQERRYRELREANMRAHELEKQLGASQGPDITQACIKMMTERLQAWWRAEGFGHVSDISFGAYSCKVEFSCNLFGDFRLVDSDTPVSDKENERLWHESLRTRGFELVKEGRRDWAVLDSDGTRAALFSLLTSRLPSVRIHEVKGVRAHNSDKFSLRSVTVFVTKIADFLQLPAPKADA